MLEHKDSYKMYEILISSEQLQIWQQFDTLEVTSNKFNIESLPKQYVLPKKMMVIYCIFTVASYKIILTFGFKMSWGSSVITVTRLWAG
jgi:hypothetical protein